MSGGGSALRPLPGAEGISRGAVLRNLLSGFVMVSLSVLLISFNRDLMKPKRFPFAAPLVLMHMAFCSVMSGVLFLLAPSLFPSLSSTPSGIKVDRRLILRAGLPIAMTFGASLVCTNLAYSHLSMAFLQMMKEGNLVLVYFFSLLAGLDPFSWRHAQVLAFASFAAGLTIRGELHFSLLGFAIQLSGQVCECIRIVLQSLLLSGKKLDPLSYVLLISPLCFVLLSFFLGLVAIAPPELVPTALLLPSWQDVHKNQHMLLANCCLAFALNVSIASTISLMSPVSFIFCGVFKDMLAVVVSVLVLNENVSSIQRLSFGLQILAVVAWSLLRSYPKIFQTHGFITGFVTVISGREEELIEADAICALKQEFQQQEGGRGREQAPTHAQDTKLAV